MELDTSRLDLNLLAALDVLLRERNVKRAAKKLGITQSAMSHKLKRLREELGDPLFVTAPGGLAPTARAESLNWCCGRWSPLPSSDHVLCEGWRS